MAARKRITVKPIQPSAAPVRSNSGGSVAARLREPSSMAGAGLILSGLAGLFMTKGLDVTAWGQVAAGVAAVVMPEGAQ